MNKLIDDLRATKSRNEKIKLLKEFKDQSLLYKVLAYTYDEVTYTYGIKSVPKDKVGLSLLQAEKLNLLQLVELLDRLVDRTYTGNNAIEYLDYILASAKISGYLDIMTCILQRDLSCGVNEGIINELFPDIIKKPKVMLISAYDPEQIVKNIIFPAFIQLKVDGARAIAIKENGKAKLVTRTGNEYKGLEHIIKTLEDSPIDNFVLDGEIIHNPSKQVDVTKTNEEQRQTSNGIVNKSIQETITPEEAKDLQYICWDFIDLQDYKTEKSTKLYFERIKTLSDFIITTKTDLNVVDLPVVRADSLEHAKEIYRQYLSLGYEGIILKNRNGIWENKRTKQAYKFKDEFDVDLKIVGCYPHKKDPTKIGGLECESADGLIKVNVGSGFFDSKKADNPMDRTGAMILHEKGELLGKVVTVRCNSLIENKQTTGYSLFLPRLICFRYDKNEANNLADIK